MAKDIYHQAVKRALEKEGWRITHDPYPLKVGRIRLFIGLGAERMVAAERDDEKIAVEIKSFTDDSPVSAFHEAIGQYDNYLLALEDEEPDRLLFLSIQNYIYESFFQEPFVQKVVARKSIKLIVYQPETEELLLW